VTGSIQNAGTLLVAGNIVGSQDLTLQGTLSVALGGNTLGTTYDQVNVTGAATLSSTALGVTLSGGFEPSSGNTFTILDAGSLTGTFSTLSLPTLRSGLSWTISYDNAGGTVLLSVTGVLPVELVHFGATTVQKTVLLDWQTALERDFDHFELERSRDGRVFTPLANRKAQGVPSVYHYVDENPYSGIHYYRLKMYDKDGKTSYSQIVSAVVGDKTYKIKVYPTRAMDEVFVTTDGGTLTEVRLFNLSGQQVLHQKDGANPLRIDLQSLAAGIYLVAAKNSEGITTTVKMMKTD
jgi:hypothetical protein